jgi:ElaB/YqjD/DUF883 family membrane-anchored ribosome-binding protein
MSTEKIRHAVDETRHRIEETSPGQLFDRALDYVKSGPGYAAAMPFFLIGAGFAWLAWSKGGESSSTMKRLRHGRMGEAIDTARERVGDFAETARNRGYGMVEETSEKMAETGRNQLKKMKKAAPELWNEQTGVTAAIGIALGAVLGATICGIRSAAETAKSRALYDEDSYEAWREGRAEMPKRDITGECDEGECRDRVREGEEERQREVAHSGVESPDYYPRVSGAKTRKAPPGSLGGHV